MFNENSLDLISDTLEENELLDLIKKISEECRRKGDDYYQKKNFSEAAFQYNIIAQAYLKAIKLIETSPKFSSLRIISDVFSDSARLWQKQSKLSSEEDREIQINSNNISSYQKSKVFPTKESRYNEGLALDRLGKYEDAIKEYDEALKIDPNYVYGLVGKGLALASLGRINEAILLYDKVLTIDANFVIALGNKGLALDSLGKYEEAIKLYDKVLEINPSDKQAFYNKGRALDILGKYEDAIKVYDAALEIDPTYLNALSGKGLVLATLGQYENAIKLFDVALNTDPKYVIALGNKGRALASLGRHEDAIKHLMKP
jgi:tetratricopeptide (TPR) repeat protein